VALVIEGERASTSCAALMGATHFLNAAAGNRWRDYALHRPRTWSRLGHPASAERESSCGSGN
jgi:nucleoside diphosphate kinase